MGRVQGKVALITGAARGQGRAHALRLAQEGADIVAVDVADDPYGWLPYPAATPADLAETVRLVEAEDRRIIARKADVRDRPALQAVVDEAIAEFGHIDVVCANAGISPMGPKAWEITPEQWDDVIGVNFTGVWNTTSVVIPHMIERQSGSIIITASGAAVRPVPNLSDYSGAKAGVVGFMKSLAQEVGRYRIRVNVIAPCTVNTPMIQHDSLYKLFCPGIAEPTREDVMEVLRRRVNLIPEPWIEPVDVANAALWLASDEARYVTGVVLPVDLGVCIK